MVWLVPILVALPMTFGHDFLHMIRSCPAVTNTQLAGCNTDCGRVEVKLGGSEPWRQVCSSSWGNKEATAVCRQLGFPKGGPMYTFQAKGAVGIWEVECEGYESSLDQCKLQLEDVGECGGVAGVFCTSAELQEEEEGLEELLEQVLGQLERRHTAGHVWENKESNGSCDILPNIPQPFTTHLQPEAFIYEEQTNNWGLPSSLVAHLSTLASSLLEKPVSSHYNSSLSAHISSTSNGTVVTARLPLPELELTLANSPIPSLVKGYLGAGARLSGYKLTRLSTKLEKQAEDNYIAGLWHHDRTGRRLKMFVFLHDVDCEEGHPTEVAVGTHKLLYYATHSVPVSRFRDSYVRRQWRTEKGCGQTGGGFIFDTHMVHKGTPRGELARNVLILEFHPKYKCSLASRMGLGLPCPSGDQYVVDKIL